MPAGIWGTWSVLSGLYCFAVLYHREYFHAWLERPAGFQLKCAKIKVDPGCSVQKLDCSFLAVLISKCNEFMLALHVVYVQKNKAPKLPVFVQLLNIKAATVKLTNWVDLNLETPWFDCMKYETTNRTFHQTPPFSRKHAILSAGQSTPSYTLKQKTQSWVDLLAAASSSGCHDVGPSVRPSVRHKSLKRHMSTSQST